MENSHGFRDLKLCTCQQIQGCYRYVMIFMYNPEDRLRFNDAGFKKNRVYFQLFLL